MSKIDKLLAEAIDRIDILMDRLWILRMKALLYVAQRLYDRIMSMITEIEGAEI